MRLKFPASPAREQVTSAISLYDAGADWNGGWMTESAYSSILGAEISERSTELVLPSSPAASTRGESDELGGTSPDAATNTWRTGPLVGGIESPTAIALDSTAPISSEGPVSSDPGTNPGTASRGYALPGDRGPRDREGGSQRPSFWRRIALGRVTKTLRDAPHENEPGSRSSDASSWTREADGEAAIGQVLAARRALATRDSSDVVAQANASVERRIVEPLLQALVSVEAKLERSHVDLVGRSDQVEQRLTQLWDIEEQLGALGELQESVLQVTEQQRRLEAALVAQTRILRWLVGGIILSLAVAAFAVAFFLRVAG